MDILAQVAQFLNTCPALAGTPLCVTPAPLEQGEGPAEAVLTRYLDGASLRQVHLVVTGENAAPLPDGAGAALTHWLRVQWRTRNRPSLGQGRLLRHLEAPAAQTGQAAVHCTLTYLQGALKNSE